MDTNHMFVNRAIIVTSTTAWAVEMIGCATLWRLKRLVASVSLLSYASTNHATFHMLNFNHVTLHILNIAPLAPYHVSVINEGCLCTSMVVLLASEGFPSLTTRFTRSSIIRVLARGTSGEEYIQYCFTLCRPLHPELQSVSF